MADDIGSVSIGYSQIFQVMNEERVIQGYNFGDFMFRPKGTKFWGSKTIIKDAKVIDSREFYDLTVGSVVGSYCTKYTLTADYKPTIVRSYGIKYDKDGRRIIDRKFEFIQCGYYRCDTFVSYILHELGVTLPTYRHWEDKIHTPFTTPLTVWNAVSEKLDKHWGDTLKTAKKSLSSSKSFQFSEKYKKAFENKSKLPSVNNVTEQELKTMPLEIFMTIVDVDKSKFTEKTLKNLLLFAKGNILSFEKRYFLIDKLGFAGNQNTIDDLIDMYKSDLNLSEKETVMLKKQILVTIQHISDDNLFNDKYKSVLIKVKNFYVDLLTSTAREDEKSIASMGVNNFRTLEEIKKNGFSEIEKTYPIPVNPIPIMK
jgi:hypothetical protein